MTTAILVIDMLRGFLEEGYALYCGERARRIIPNVQRLLERERSSPIFFACDHHIPNDPEFAIFPPHAIEGTTEAEVIPELAKYPGEIVPKRHYSAFYGTRLDERLKERRAEKLIVCGVATNICVMYTVADAWNRGYEIEVPVDCVASLNERAHRYALEHMEKVLGAKLTRVHVSP